MPQFCISALVCAPTRFELIAKFEKLISANSKAEIKTFWRVILALMLAVDASELLQWIFQFYGVMG
jgi:hypothetical protein